MVWEVRKALPNVPIFGIGGIETVEHVLEFLIAGANAVQVGTANFRDPGVSRPPRPRPRALVRAARRGARRRAERDAEDPPAAGEGLCLTAGSGSPSPSTPPSGSRLLELARLVAPEAGVLKVGLEAFCAHGPALVAEVAALAPVFLDLKLHDIPNTVGGAAAAAARTGASILNVHAGGGREMMRVAGERAREAAAAAGSPAPKVIAVTVLTSLDAAALGRGRPRRDAPDGGAPPRGPREGIGPRRRRLLARGDRRDPRGVRAGVPPRRPRDPAGGERGRRPEADRDARLRREGGGRPPRRSGARSPARPTPRPPRGRSPARSRRVVIDRRGPARRPLLDRDLRVAAPRRAASPRRARRRRSPRRGSRAGPAGARSPDVAARWVGVRVPPPRELEREAGRRGLRPASGSSRPFRTGSRRSPPRSPRPAASSRSDGRPPAAPSGALRGRVEPGSEVVLEAVPGLPARLLPPLSHARPPRGPARSGPSAVPPPPSPSSATWPDSVRGIGMWCRKFPRVTMRSPEATASSTSSRSTKGRSSVRR